LCCRPIPDREFVEGYIKAYYFPENQLEGWLPEHRVGPPFSQYEFVTFLRVSKAKYYTSFAYALLYLI